MDYLIFTFDDRLNSFNEFYGDFFDEMYGYPMLAYDDDNHMVDEQAIEKYKNEKSEIFDGIKFFLMEYVDLNYININGLEMGLFQAWMIHGFAENFKSKFEEIYLNFVKSYFYRTSDKKYVAYHIKYVCAKYKIKAVELMKILNPIVFDERVSGYLGDDLTYELSLY